MVTDPKSDAQETVLIDYVNLLGRLPTVSETNYWVDGLVTKNWTTQQVAGAIAFSPEGIVTQQAQDITSLYLALLDKSPDAPGLKFWTDVYHRGDWSLNQIADYFANTSDSKALYPSTASNAENVTKLYSKLFLAQPSTAQVDKYVGALNSGLSFAALATSLASEYKTVGAIDDLSGALNNQVFHNFLRATHVGDPSYDVANSTFHLADGGIYVIPSAVSAAPPTVTKAAVSTGAGISVGSTADYVGTPERDIWQFDPYTWDPNKTFDAKEGHDIIKLDIKNDLGGYRIDGSKLKGVDFINVQGYYDAHVTAPGDIILGQGISPEHFNQLEVNINTESGKYTFTLRSDLSGAPFNPHPQIDAGSVLEPGQWFASYSKDPTRVNTFDHELTYFDTINSHVSHINVTSNDSASVFQMIKGDLVMFGL